MGIRAMALQNGLSSQAITPGNIGRAITVGPMQGAPLSKLMDDERRDAETRQAAPIIASLAGHVRKHWQVARDARQQYIDDRMHRSIRARRGEYDPEKLAQIQATGGAETYAMLTSVKCRAAASWLRDVMLANGTEKPWTIRPTPVPMLHPQLAEQIVAKLVSPIAEAQLAGRPLEDQQITDALGELRDQAMNELRAQATRMSERMESKMEDQLVEGGFTRALNQFIDDIVTFPAAILKGPIARNKNLLKWVQDNTGEWTVTTERQMRLEWERVSPFNIYPSPESEGVNDGYLIEKHRLSRTDLNDLIGVDGYDDSTIRMVLDMYSRNGLRDWLYDDLGRADAEGKSSTQLLANPDGLIDALQYWGSVPGSLLIEWGMSPKDIKDKTQEYHCEVWVIGPYVIKATINYHPLAEKPYYKTSYEEIPGSFWGNSPCDLIRDAQVVVNAAIRGLVNNMGMASGPQVVVNIDRLAAGEPINTLTPWRIWQVTADPAGNGAASQQPVYFEQPDSRIPELSSVIKMFMDLADEWSGIPKYLTGDATGGGAGRTASGLSMLMSNAGKSLKQVVANVDNYVMRPMLQRLHYWNMRYGDDPDLKGDINVVVRGANALVAKEAAQQARNIFLQTTANPIDMQIIGMQGRAHVLREVVKQLDMDADKIIPPANVLRQREAAVLRAQQEAAAAEQAQSQPELAQPPTPAQLGGPSESGQALADGSPVTDNFSPPRQ